MGQTHLKSNASQKLHYIEFSTERLEGQLFMWTSSEQKKGVGLSGSLWCAYSSNQGQAGELCGEDEGRCGCHIFSWFLFHQASSNTEFKAGETTGLPRCSPLQTTDNSKMAVRMRTHRVFAWRPTRDATDPLCVPGTWCSSSCISPPTAFCTLLFPGSLGPAHWDLSCTRNGSCLGLALITVLGDASPIEPGSSQWV